MSILVFHASVKFCLCTQEVQAIVRCEGCLCTSSGWFKRIEPSRTFSNLLEPRLYRTYIFTGETRFAGCSWMNSTHRAISAMMWFEKVRGGSLVPPRTSARAPCTPSFPCKDVVREGSVLSNNPELV